MKKILIIGICGAGKSTFAKSLGQKINLPIIHLDQHFWKPNWIESDQGEWKQKVKKLAEEPLWIMEGNYSSSFETRFSKADTLIILDYNPLIAIYRATKRIIIHYGKTRPDMASNCPERFNWEFYKFMWNFNKNHRPRVNEAIKNNKLNIYRFKTPKEAKLFLENI